MNKIKKFSSMLSVLLLALTLQAQQTPNTQNADFVPGQVLIKLKESAKAKKTSLSTQMNASTVKSYPTLGFELWDVKQADEKQATLALIEQYKNHPDVEFVEPNYLVEAIGGTEPNDPYFPQLWGLHNTGQNGGTEDADIDAPEAYCMPISAIDVVVGIVDTGIDYTHEDLAQNIWQNLGEDADGDGKVLIKSGNTWIFDPGDVNGIDDDGNGYADDFVGWDFAHDDNDPMDLHSHGTHCAGTVGAIMNNNTGISGVAPNAKLAALKFLNDNGGGTTTDAIDAINYAVAMGIPITNNSWGGGGYSAALYQAIQNAEANNHLFVAAAGNYSLDNDQYFFYPASYDHNNVFAVAATDRNDNKSSFSHYGATTVDIGAPGSQIYSCIPYNNYANKSGTSMAAPHIAGVCAFVLGANPDSDYNTIKNALINSVDPLSALNGKCVSGGRVNLQDALVEMGAPANPCDDEACDNPPCDPPLTCDPQRDRNALIALYNATDGANWTNTWDLNQPMDTWHGVHLNGEGCVTCIDLDGDPDDCNWRGNTGNNLIGTIPAELGDLKSLTRLRFKDNELEGSIPPELGTLTNLTMLNFTRNELTGNIPSELGDLINLTELKLGANNLTGIIPPELGNLTLLKTLYLGYNDLNGNIPPELKNLINLTSLHLEDNELTGIIPTELKNLIKLTNLYLFNNNLTGTIPAEFGQLINLQQIRLHYNNLSGSIPPTFSNLNELTVFRVNNNNLSGCYDSQLQELLCTILPASDYFEGNQDVSDNNNFDATWEDFCATGAGSCGTLVSQVWPGDFDNNGIAEINDLLYWGAAYNNTGASRPSATINWVGQDCENWTTEVNGINNKHQDGNGDGVVNNADINALIQNFGQSHSFSAPTGLASTMQFNLTPDFIVNIFNSDNNITYDFFVEDTGNTVSAHGVSASIFFGALNVVSATINIEGSSLNPQEVLQDFDEETNTLHFSLTKTNGINTTLNGSVCKVQVQVLEIDTGESFALNINSGGIMQADGTLHEVAGTTVNDTYYEILPLGLIALNVSTSHASCSNGGSATVNAFGGSGNYSYQWNTGENTQQITDLNPGIYAVVVSDEEGNSSVIDAEVQGNFIPIYDEEGNIIPCVNALSTGRQSGIFTGQVQINGIPAEEGDWLTAFDQSGNIAGLDLLSFSSGKAYISLSIYGDDLTTPGIDEGINAGEYFTLQLFDASENTYHDYKLNGQIAEFTDWENTNGTPISSYSNTNKIYNFGGSGAICNQSINLNAGWNLISFNNSPDNNTVANVFAGLQTGNLEFVTGFDKGAQLFDPDLPPFANTLKTIDDGFGYWVKIANADVLTAQGGCIDSGFRKPLDAGWNLIAYPPIVQQSPSTYFADLISSGNLEFVTGFDNGAQLFDPDLPPFANTLQQMKNGFGYWVKVTNPVAKTANNFTNVFSFVYGNTNLTDGEQVKVLNQAGETIALIDVVENSYLMTTPIYGDDQTTAIKENVSIGENLRFSWNNQIANETIAFKGDLGLEQLHLQFKLKNDIPSLELGLPSLYQHINLIDMINVYPNPIQDKACIMYNLEQADDVTITLLSIDAKYLTTIVENQVQQAGQHQMEVNTNDLPTGIYYLKLQSKVSNTIKKVVISR